MKCPNCGTTLVMTDRQGVEIDYCPDCRGVWLDKGELDKIIERAAQFESGSSSGTDRGYEYDRDYDRDQNKDRKYTHKKRRGFLGDMFDFD